MAAVPGHAQISVADYLQGEKDSVSKHDFIDGVVFAMARGNVRHNRIAPNILGTLHGQLRGGPCRPFNSDMKVRVRFEDHTRFYYPDVSVVCRSNPDEDAFQDEPVVLFEVLSESTRRTDQNEKKDAYLTIPSLGAYILVERNSPTALLHRCGPGGAKREVYQGLETVMDFPEMGASLSLLDVFEGLSLD